MLAVAVEVELLTEEVLLVEILLITEDLAVVEFQVFIIVNLLQQDQV